MHSAKMRASNQKDTYARDQTLGTPVHKPTTHFASALRVLLATCEKDCLRLELSGKWGLITEQLTKQRSKFVMATHQYATTPTRVQKHTSIDQGPTQGVFALSVRDVVAMAMGANGNVATQRIMWR